MKHLIQPSTISGAKLPVWIAEQAAKYISIEAVPPWCGHYCLMMIAGITFEEACIVTGHIGAMTQGEILQALKKLKIKAQWIDARHVSISVMHCAIAQIISYDEPNWSHWIVMNDYKIYDPAKPVIGWHYGGSCHVSGYIEIDKNTLPVEA